MYQATRRTKQAYLPPRTADQTVLAMCSPSPVSIFSRATVRTGWWTSSARVKSSSARLRRQSPRKALTICLAPRRRAIDQGACLCVDDGGGI